jgi:hypothetical protein
VAASEQDGCYTVGMDRYYELWDQRTRNCLGSYGAEWEALAVIRELEADALPVDGLALIWGDADDDDAGGPIAEGIALLALARATDPGAG